MTFLYVSKETVRVISSVRFTTVLKPLCDQ